MNLLEKITRSNIYLYLLSKHLYQNYLYFFFYEKELRILKFIKNNDKIILDIGSNNGVSARSMRLFNKADSTQIIKNASLTSFDTQRYGKQMLTLNLGVVPTVANVYNQINNDTGKQIVVGTGGVNNSANTSEEIAAALVVKTQFVTSFRDRLKIKAAISPAKIQTITEENDSTN